MALALVAILAATSGAITAGRRLLDAPIFVLRGPERAEALSCFERVDDQIMGGISQSALVPSYDGECASFLGVVRTDGGGFCGTRSRLLSKPLNLGGYSGIYLRVRGDGKRYKLNVRTSEEVGELVYQCAFLPPAEMATVRLPFTAFRLVKRSNPVPSPPPLDPHTIYQLGVVLSRFAFGEESSNDAFAAGPFRVDIEEIGAFRDELDFEAAIDEPGAPVARSAGPPLSAGLQLWPEGEEPRRRGGLRARLLRFVFRRVRGTLRQRVVARRSERASKLWALRKQGRKLSELRRAETAPTPAPDAEARRGS
ncbi:hypothetical protein KFE25_006248 [Diacronema lutheri]|uniref:NADH:ubiquinone oxidoreductase intermediate-associated protein 30 domain-containing protein n=2 Tax=Diacronema lutheri TaxID=2081491 RepID=A0A8J6CJD1_DIALT|nr:hypothetical protein KFE25_006248 [Diacronema lutheri]